MNNKNILDLTLRLSHALDTNYDVVNMEAVLSVISVLEGTPITKEQLETTRLAKYINQLRRRTKCEHLARRAKSLLKKWREMVGMKQQQQQLSTIMQQQTSSMQYATSSVGVADVDGKYGRHVNNLAIASSTAPATLTISANSNVYNINSNSNKGLNHVHTDTSDIKSIYNHANEDDSSGGGAGGILKAHQYNQTDHENATKMQPTSFANIFKDCCSDSLIPSIGKQQAHYTTNSNEKQHQKSRHSGRTLLLSPQLQNHNHMQHEQMETYIIDQSSNSNSDVCYKLENVKPPTSSNQMPTQIVIDIQDSNSSQNLNPIPTTPIKTTTNLTTIPIPSTPKVDSSETEYLHTTTTLPVASAHKLNTSENSNVKKSKKEKKRFKDRDLFSKENKQTEQLVVMIDDTSISMGQSQQQQRKHNKHETDINAEERSRLTSNPTTSNMSEPLSLSNSSMSSLFPNDTYGGTLSGRAMTDEQNMRMDLNITSNNDEKKKSSDLTFAGKFKHQNNSGILSTTDFSVSSTNNPSLHLATTTTTLKPIASTSVTTTSSKNQFLPFRANITHDQQQQLQKNVNPTANITAETADAIINTSSSNIKLEEKVPKKRGRKKGSKGVDSVIAKETSLSSQMLISSLGTCKKVKTTKELYVEMQNRKMSGNTPSKSTSPLPTMPTSWTNSTQLTQQQLSRPTSSCSEPSLNSPRTLDACSTNATVSTMATRSTPDNCIVNIQPDEAESASDTMTSEEYSQDSMVARKRLNVRDFSIDSNSNTLLPNAMRDTISDSKKPLVPVVPTTQPDTKAVPTLLTLEKQLHDYLKQLPSISILSTDTQYTSAQEILPCTCDLIEITPDEQNQITNVDQQNSSNNEINPTDQKSTELQNPLLIKTEGVYNDYDNLNGQKLKSTTSPHSNSTLDQNLNTFEEQRIKIIGSVQPSQQHQTAEKPIKREVKKSIFDLDFDDEDDPLHTLMAEAAAIKNDVITTTTNDYRQTNKNDHEHAEVDLNRVKQLLSNEHINMPQALTMLNSPTEGKSSLIASPVPYILPMYQVHEDPNCAAKQRFDIQTQKITKFHVNALHNCYIPNVNGNWDCGDNTIELNNYMTNDCTSLNNHIVIGDGSTVVPKYGALITEHLRKDLRHIQYAKHVTANRSRIFVTIVNEEKHAEFLGVARGLLSPTPKTTMTAIAKRKRYCSKCHQKSCHQNRRLSTETEQWTTEEKRFEHPRAQMLLGAERFSRSNKIVPLSTITVDVDGNNSLHASEYREERHKGTLLSIATMKSEESHLSESLDEATYAELHHEHQITVLRQNNNSNDENNHIEMPHDDHEAHVSNTIDNNKTKSHNDSNLSTAITFKPIHCNRKRRKHTDKTDGGKDSVADIGSETHRVIKRFRIALFGGDVTKQRQVFNLHSSSSNSSSSDHDHEDNEHNNNEINIADDHDNTYTAQNLHSEDAHGTNITKSNIVHHYEQSHQHEQHCRIENQSDCNKKVVADNIQKIYNDDADDDYDEDEEYNSVGDYHEIVARSTNKSNNHIVLTIKKTNKTSSPSSIQSNAVSPIESQANDSDTEKLETGQQHILQKLESESKTESEYDGITQIVFKENTVNQQSQCTITTTDFKHLDDKKCEDGAENISVKVCETIHDQNAQWKCIKNLKDEMDLVDTKDIRNLQNSDDNTLNANKILSRKMTKIRKLQNCPLFFPDELYRRYYKTGQQENNGGSFIYDGYIFKNLDYNSDTNESDNDDHIRNLDSFERSIALNMVMEEAANISITTDKGNGIFNNENENGTSYCNINCCICDSEYEEKSKSTVTTDAAATTVADAAVVIKTEPSCIATHTKENISINTNTLDIEGTTVGEIEKAEECKLSVSNNGMLLSFNNIDANELWLNNKPAKNDITLTDAVSAISAADFDDNYDNGRCKSLTAVMNVEAVDNQTALEVGGEEKQFKLSPKENCDVYIKVNINNNNNKNNNTSNISNDTNPNNNHSNNSNENNSSNNMKQEHRYKNDNDDHNHDKSVHFIKKSTVRNYKEKHNCVSPTDNDKQNNNISNAYNIPMLTSTSEKQLNSHDENDMFKENDLINHTATTPTTASSHSPTTMSTTKPPLNAQTTLNHNNIKSEISNANPQHKEYITGFRAVDEDVDDEHGKNCARIQQFKEWHQVLQLRSYNDELLTVLPYVVLE